MKTSDIHPPLDLIEVRRQLIALRSLHSNDRRVAYAINSLMGKLAHLHGPENRRHEDRLLKTIAKTIRRVDEILASEPKGMDEAGSRGNSQADN